MTKLEQKVNALIRVVLADNQIDYQKAKAELTLLSLDDREDPVEVEGEIRKILVEIGMPDNLLGHRYSVEAIRLVAENEDYIHMIHRKLYPAIAEKFDVVPKQVERNIRRGIESAWDRGDLKVLAKYFGNTVSRYSCRPTVGEFIARIANEANQRMKEANRNA